MEAWSPPVGAPMRASIRKPSTVSQVTAADKELKLSEKPRTEDSFAGAQPAWGTAYKDLATYLSLVLSCLILPFHGKADYLIIFGTTR